VDVGVAASPEEVLSGVVWNAVGGWSSHVSDLRPWVQRADFGEWANGLQIRNLTENEWKDAIQQAETDLRGADEETPVTVAWLKDMSFVRGWSIEETRQHRHSVGATKSFVVLSTSEWIFLEMHWES
jgi:hypothetical protein